MNNTLRIFSFALMLSLTAPALALDVGAKLPDVTLTDLQGKPVSLASLKGKVVVIDFWASWCAPCREAMPALDKVFKRQQAKGLVIVGASVDREKDKAEAFLKQVPVAFTVVHDDGHKLADVVKPPKMPSSYVFGRDGQLKFVHEGYHAGDDQKIEKELTELLGAGAPAAPAAAPAAAHAKGKKHK